ncbi:MAG: hypothetical protein LIO87_08250 [Eubacterium sp.]|nr:hypothetical protein [Eubacterium sp.]
MNSSIQGLKRRALKIMMANKKYFINFAVLYFIFNAVILLLTPVPYVILILCGCLFVSFVRTHIFGSCSDFAYIFSGRTNTLLHFAAGGAYNDRPKINEFSKNKGKYKDRVTYSDKKYFTVFFCFIIFTVFTALAQTRALYNYINGGFKNVFSAAVIAYAVLAALVFALLLIYMIKFIFAGCITADLCHDKDIIRSSDNNTGFAEGDLYEYNGRKFNGTLFGEIIESENNALKIKCSLSKIVLLTLSFWGWFILSLVTLGFGFAFLIPYYNMTIAELYLSEKSFLHKNYNAK